MAEPNGQKTGRVPRALRAVQVILYFQAAVLLLGVAAGVALAVHDELAGGWYPDPVELITDIVNFVFAVVSVVCAVKIVARPFPWVWTLAVVLEGITVLAGIGAIVYGILTGAGVTTGPVQAVIGGVTIGLLVRTDARAWRGRDGNRNVAGTP